MEWGVPFLVLGIHVRTGVQKELSAVCIASLNGAHQWCEAIRSRPGVQLSTVALGVVRGRVYEQIGYFQVPVQAR